MAAKHKVSIITYDTSKDDSPEMLEKILSKIHTDPDKYEILSFDKNITPVGSFVCVLIYKELPAEDEDINADGLEITVDENGDIVDDNSTTVTEDIDI